MQWSLRDAKEADIGGMMLVQLSCFQRTLSHYYSQDQVEHLVLSQSVQAFTSLINEDHCIVAEDDSTGAIVAFGCIGKTSSGDFTAKCDFELQKLYVSPSVSRRGLGSRLFRELERRVMNQSGHGIGVVSTLNAVPFYQSCGFRVTMEDGIVYFEKKPFECKHLEKWLN